MQENVVTRSLLETKLQIPIAMAKSSLSRGALDSVIYELASKTNFPLSGILDFAQTDPAVYSIEWQPKSESKTHYQKAMYELQKFPFQTVVQLHATTHISNVQKPLLSFTVPLSTSISPLFNYNPEPTPALKDHVDLIAQDVLRKFSWSNMQFKNPKGISVGSWDAALVWLSTVLDDGMYLFNALKKDRIKQVAYQKPPAAAFLHGDKKENNILLALSESSLLLYDVKFQ